MSNTFRTYIFSVCLFCSLSILAQEQADFLLIESPSELVIYNKYEQAITTSEQRLFASYTPLQLLEEETTLSDAFTPAAKLKVGRNTFFLVKESVDTYRNQDRAGRILLIRNVELINDSLQLLNVNGLEAARIPGESTKSFDLQNNQQLHRLLRYRGYSFVKTLGVPTRFGWVKLSRRPGRSWKALEATKEITDIASIRSGIERQIANANSVYSRLYAHFNSKHNKSLSAPQWQISSDNTSSLVIQLIPHDPANDGTASLLEKLQRSLAGSPFQASLSDATIQISPKNGEAGR